MRRSEIRGYTFKTPDLITTLDDARMAQVKTALLFALGF